MSGRGTMEIFPSNNLISTIAKEITPTLELFPPLIQSTF